MNKETKNLLDRITSIMYDNVLLQKENVLLKNNINETIIYINRFFTNCGSLNPYVLLEKLGGNNNGK